MQHGRLSQQ